MGTNLIKTLSSYVPALILRRLAADPTPISEATAERCSAAVLFADITDFTAMADGLADRDQVGSEQLALLLNDYFGKLIGVIDAHGGEITKFAGDALLALWPVPDKLARRSTAAMASLREMAHQAVQCGLAIQDAMSDYETVGGFHLATQVGIGAGDVYSVHLGGVFNRWEFLLSGSPLVQITQAKERAKPGRVVSSPYVWDLVKEYCSGEELDAGFVEVVDVKEPNRLHVEAVPVLTTSAKQSLESYVPAAILSRLEAGHENWLSELRKVAVMFIKLPQYGTSIKHPYMRTLPQAQAVMQALQRALYRYSGSINKLNVDDKGITLVAALGLPPLSHGDDSARAIHAALEMQDALAELGRNSVIGITTGWVYCGPIGSDLRREYTMVGNTVNMAARLMQTAEQNLPGTQLSGLIVDRPTYLAVMRQSEDARSLASRIRFDEFSLIDVKGLLDPVAAYRPRLSTRPIHQEQQNRPSGGKIIGRVSEVDLLRKCLVDLKRGQLSEANRLVVIEGVEGTGKSLLLANLLELAQQLRMTILYGAGHALEKATPYYAWRPIFREIFGVKTLFDDIVALRAHVFGQLPPIRGERGYPAFAIRLSPFLNDVLPLNLPENTTTQAMSPGERRRMTRFFLLRLLQRTIQGAKGRKAHPTLLVLDNGQWMDDLSWELVESVGNMVDSAVMVVATRPIFEQVTVGTVSSTCRRLKDSSRGTWLQMPALTESETIELICHRLGVNSLSEEVLGELRAKAKGHPLFSEDLIRSWLKEGLVTVDSGECRLTDHGSLSGEILPPDQVHGAIIGRLERLEPEHQLVLKVASVLGPSFTIGELERIYPDVPDKQKLATNLNLLVRFGLLKHTLSHSTTTYAFSYALLREVACSLLPFTTRQDLRNMIAS